MIEKTRKEILLIIYITSLIFAVSLALSLWFSAQLDKPEFCSSCHEMQEYYTSYINPRNGSLIAGHELNCIQCHANETIYDAKKKIATEIIIHRLNLSGPFILPLDLKSNCLKCHSLPATSIHKSLNLTNCTGCHGAHKPAPTGVSLLPVIPYGFHKNQTCQNCHGTTIQIPRCINCHAGHGEQKLENSLCLSCHIDPHDPVLPTNTVKFSGNLPFTSCQPCHEKEYYELTNSGSLHTANQTCIMCHTAHGEKPGCSLCHRAMQVKKHLDFFECRDCHRTDGLLTCQECHGRSHDWSASTAGYPKK